MPELISVVIPAYNEEGTVGKAIEESVAILEALEKSWEIVVVDDGSTDRTSEMANLAAGDDERVRVIRHERNIGKGAAVRTGMRAAAGTVRFFLDADLSTHPRHIQDALPLLKDHQVVIGSREAMGAIISVRQPWPRVVCGKLFGLAARTLLDIPWRDTQCGFKAFRAEAHPLFNCMTTDGWTFDAELLARARRERLSVAELPVVWHDRAKSRVRFRDAGTVVKDMLRIARLMKKD